MSTLRAVNLQHPSSTAVNATLTSGGNLTGAGMDLITSQSFSAAASASINNCFTSTYQNYRVVVSCDHSLGAQLWMRLRASGSDTSSAYSSKMMYSDFTASTVNGDFTINNGTYWWVGTGATKRMVTLDISKPAIGEATSFAAFGGDSSRGSAGGGYHATAAAYDGFSIIAGAGTISGDVKVYGYRNG